MKSSWGLSEREKGACQGPSSQGWGCYDTPQPCENRPQLPRGFSPAGGPRRRECSCLDSMPLASVCSERQKSSLALNSKCNRTTIYKYMIYKRASLTFRWSAINYTVDIILLFFPIFFLLLEAVKSQSWIFFFFNNPLAYVLAVSKTTCHALSLAPPRLTAIHDGYPWLSHMLL